MADEKCCFRQLKCGEWAYCVDGYVFDEDKKNSEPKIGLLALLSTDAQAYAKRGEAHKLVQFDKLVKHGMILTRHVFQGLKRPLRTDGNSESDKLMQAHSRKPSYNYSWNGRVIQEAAPKNTVFVVVVRPNTKHKEKYPEVDGWLNSWTWVDDELGLAEAPIDWVGRYDKKIWTRKDD